MKQMTDKAISTQLELQIKFYVQSGFSFMFCFIFQCHLC